METRTDPRQCWIDKKFEKERLWTHYVWIFLSEFGSVVLYTILFFYLRRRVAASAALSRGQSEQLRRLRRVVGYMILYPIAYVILSLPLAAGRMATVRGDVLNIPYFCVAGAMMTSSGFVDVIMYTLTRRALLIESEPTHSERRLSIPHHGGNHSHVTTVSAETKSFRKENGRLSRRTVEDDESQPERDGSTDHIIQHMELGDIGRVYQKTTIEITHEPARSGMDLSPSNSISGPGHRPSGIRWGKKLPPLPPEAYQ
jgi:hypothetical protein